MHHCGHCPIPKPGGEGALQPADGVVPGPGSSLIPGHDFPALLALPSGFLALPSQFFLFHKKWPVFAADGFLSPFPVFLLCCLGPTQ